MSRLSFSWVATDEMAGCMGGANLYLEVASPVNEKIVINQHAAGMSMGFIS